jgi:malonyl-CoA O-methyltransferase
MSAPNLPNKRDVRRSFDAAASTYDTHAFLQREIAARLDERLDLVRMIPKRVLDMGCGTGEFTERLAARYPSSELVALDLAAAMVARTRHRLTPGWWQRLTKPQQLRALVADAEALPLAPESIDLATSNLTLQWCDPQAVAREVAHVLRPEGLFLFTTFGPDTLKELRAAFKHVDDQPHVNTFVDMHDLGDLLVAAGFADPVMDQETITLTYTELKTLLRELKGIGAHNVLPHRAQGLMGRHRWAKLNTGYEVFRHDGKLPATYEVVYGHAWKPALTKQRIKGGTQAVSLAEFKRMVKPQ